MSERYQLDYVNRFTGLRVTETFRDQGEMDSRADYVQARVADPLKPICSFDKEHKPFPSDVGDPESF